MRITLTDRLVSRGTPEGAAVSFAAKVYDDSTEPWTLTVPTSLRYRIDDPEYGCQIQDWSSLTADDESTITVTGTQNTISGCQSRERRRITVEADHGLSTGAVAYRDYFVINGMGFP